MKRLVKEILLIIQRIIYLRYSIGTYTGAFYKYLVFNIIRYLVFINIYLTMQNYLCMWWVRIEKLQRSKRLASLGIMGTQLRTTLKPFEHHNNMVPTDLKGPSVWRKIYREMKVFPDDIQNCGPNHIFLHSPYLLGLG